MLLGIGQVILASLQAAFFMFWETLWPLLLGFGLSGAVQAFVARSEMERALGNRQPRTLVLASLLGAVSSSCSYAASAMAKSLFQKGADFTASITFMLASTNLVIELGLVLWILIGWQFAISELVGGVIMIALLGVIARFFFPSALVDAARRRLQPANESPHEHGVAAGGQRAWGSRLRSLSGWADAASYSIADLTMLRRELILGYVIAGFLAVAVPDQVWNLIFLNGHGLLTSIENALVGPLIAVISFVCSVGNVPLAAALWKGGISFGGVVSFIFADLITFPLILIYRKFYGLALTLRLATALWLVMAAAGLAAEGLFSVAGLVPTSRPIQVVRPGWQWNYTTFLNVAFLGLLAFQCWLARHRQQLGGGAEHEIDPVCGMQVPKASAPGRCTHEGRTYVFCSDHCRERFEKAPDRFSRADRQPSSGGDQ